MRNLIIGLGFLLAGGTALADGASTTYTCQGGCAVPSVQTGHRAHQSRSHTTSQNQTIDRGRHHATQNTYARPRTHSIAPTYPQGHPNAAAQSRFLPQPVTPAHTARNYSNTARTYSTRTHQQPTRTYATPTRSHAANTRTAPSHYTRSAPVAPTRHYAPTPSYGAAPATRANTYTAPRPSQHSNLYAPNHSANCNMQQPHTHGQGYAPHPTQTYTQPPRRY